MKIKYGLSNNNIDVTAICKEKLLTNNIITIPKGDHNRAYLFTDPLFNNYLFCSEFRIFNLL